MINQAIKYRLLTFYLYLWVYMWAKNRITAQPHVRRSNDRSELVAADRYLGSNVNDASNPVPAEQRGYLYDPIGNRTQATAAGAAVDYAANALNQYSAVGADTPIYDEDGNMIFGPYDTAYTYNAENRLIAAQPQTPADGDTRVEYLYDYMGRRVQKIVYVYGSGSWNQDKEVLFVYDGWNLVKETTTAAGQSAVDKYYVWGLDLSHSLQGAGGVGGLLAVIEGSLTYHYLYDANGNVGQIVDAGDGSIVAHYDYDPYGNLVNQAGAYADGNAYRFSTKYFDSETKLYYYGYRYYSTDLGRWVNRDPLEELGFEYVLAYLEVQEELNRSLLSFCNNDPINTYDLHGLAGETLWDAFNVGLDVLSLCSNIAAGNVAGALTDGAALVIDIAATAVPFVPGGAGSALKAYRIAKLSKANSPLAKSMMKIARGLNKGKGGATDVKKLARYVLLEGDEAHHIIPIAGANRRWMKGVLYKKMEKIRQKAMKAGIDLNDSINGVSLMSRHHKQYTQNSRYYLDVYKKFKDLKGDPSELGVWKARINEIAETLLYRSGKWK